MSCVKKNKVDFPRKSWRKLGFQELNPNLFIAKVFHLKIVVSR